MRNSSEPRRIAVVIPSYKVSASIIPLLAKIPEFVEKIFIIDDCCPENSGKLVESACKDPRVQVVYHSKNQGVGGAVCTGYRHALDQGYEVAVKVDGDGQMDPKRIADIIKPIVEGEADYVKGNRFFSIEDLRDMPALRLFGNAVLSFVNKASSGYWNLMDPTNGFTAIHEAALRNIPLDKIDRRYFFESDLLFRLNTIRAVVAEVPMRAHYGDEKSNLSIAKVSVQFPSKYLSRFFKRIFYNYLLRDFNICSLQLLFGIILCLFGASFGGYHYYLGWQQNQNASTGTVMVAVLPIIIGFQLLLAAVSFDALNIPSKPLQRR